MTFLEFVVVLFASPIVGILAYGTYRFNREDDRPLAMNLSLSRLTGAVKTWAAGSSAPSGEALRS
ncbi:MAG: hypothetical protein AAGF28_02575 [Pseudomonadota bacterium]